MKQPEKHTEKLSQTIVRSIVTTTFIALILSIARLCSQEGMSKTALFGIIWLMIFCIVLIGHWMEVLFINYVKFALPLNIIIFYATRLVYWYLCAIPLFILIDWIGKLLTHNSMHLGKWESFGFFYIGIELFMHLIMQLRGKKSFYNGVY